MKRYLAIACLFLAIPLFAQQIDWTQIPGAKLMVPVKEQTAIGEFNDTIFYTAADVRGLTVNQITAKANVDKALRVKNWVAFVDAASKQVPKEPTAEELVIQQADIQKRMDEVLAKLVKTGAKADLQKVAAPLKASSDALAVSIVAVGDVKIVK